MLRLPVFALSLLLAIAAGLGAPSPELPGEEVQEGDYKPTRTQTEKKAPQKKRITQDKKGNWLSPSITEQLSQDKTLIGMGFGALFVPTYTESRLEPEVLVFDPDGEEVAEGSTGKRILLEAGNYRVAVGSGILNNRMTIRVSVVEGHTEVLNPFWSGLILETLDDGGTYLAEEYEVYSMDRGISFGKGYGLREERVKDIETWILPAGMYKITRVGQDLTSLTNYITVQLNPGELSIVELVFTGGNLIAGGIKDVRARTKGAHNWHYGLRLGGTFAYTSRINNYKEESTDLSLFTDLKFRAKFDNSTYFGISEMRLKNQFLKRKGKPFESIEDELQLRSSWVRRLNEWMGPYVRARGKSHLFPIQQEIELGRTALILNTSGDTIQFYGNYPAGTRPDSISIKGVQTAAEFREKFQTSPSFFPMETSIGVGLNFELLSSYLAEVSTQIGLGMKQFLTRRELVNDDLAIKNTANEWRPRPSLNTLGLEHTLNARFHLGNRLSLDILSEILLRNGKVTDITIDELIFDLRFNLTRNLELTYTFELEDRILQTSKDSPNRFDYINGILLRILLNF